MSRKTTATIRTKVMPCKYCGVGMQVGITTRKAPWHPKCASDLAEKAIREIAAGKGPGYEKWKAGMAKFAARIQ